ncbi:conserved hypothetical protein [Solidesulfovibrio fructosivorans JJ]]|uniref:Uncharacterized protein n=2 Tax=Solidesulfovibrio fructosivorans TaxID=878 RepID=E1K0F5_SOLFR|nr:conserved hypothetical protein [Solidesulfovibrio fructosivorans JJ]]
MEVVVVLIVLGILAVIAINRLEPRNPHAMAEADALRSVLRYAQSRAMSDVYTWGVRFTSSSYALVTGNSSQTPVLLGQDTATHTLPDGVACSWALSGGGDTIWFNWRGEPVTGIISTLGGTAAKAGGPQTVTLTESGLGVTVTVTPYTGFVP